MSVTGWSNGGLRSWGSTTGDETGTIVADNGSGQTGFLTRDQNNGIGDFEFTSTIKTTSDGGFAHGGVVFGLQDANNFYSILYEIRWNGTFIKMYKNNDSGDATSGTQIGSEGTVASTNETFNIKVVKVGSTFTVDIDSVQAFTVSDTTYSTGNVGYIYPSASWNGNLSEYTFIEVKGGAPAQRRRIMVVS